MITVSVHRQPIKEVRGKEVIRVKHLLESFRLPAEFIQARGIYVYFPFNDDRVFTKQGAGVGKMKDWIIDPKDVVLLHAMAKKK